jgi:GAF domain-containing protein
MHLRRSKKFDSEIDVDSVIKNLDRVNAVNLKLRSKQPRGDLDRLTQEASERLHAPTARVTLVDDYRQVFIKAFGRSNALGDATETSLDSSYCKYVVAYNDVLVVEDAEHDPLVRDNKATELGLRSYLGVPLRSQGQVIGSFCVFDDKPREWSMEDLNGLEEIAHEVMQHIDDEIEDSEQ